jgi:uncharacterized protein
LLGEPGDNSAEKLEGEASSVSGSGGGSGASPERPPGWGRSDRHRLLLWAGIAVIPTGVYFYVFHRRSTWDGSTFHLKNELATKFVTAFFVSLATWEVSRIEKRPLDDYGIPLRKAFGKRFWEGCIWGFAMLSAILLVLRVLGSFQIDSVALSGVAVYRYALGWAAAFLLVSISEELSFRGYWLFSISRRLRFWRGALFVSTIFAVAHISNHGENVVGILQVFAFGMLLCLTIRRTGTLWFALGFHAAWDWAETFFYGTPDSGLLGDGRLLNTSVHGPSWLTGGTAGPEGSVIALLVLLLCAFLIHLRFPKAIYLDRPV